MLTVSEKYMIEQTITLYDQILYSKFYSLLWKGQQILAVWDFNNKYLSSLLVGDISEEEKYELQQILYEFEENSLTSNE